PPLRPQPRAVEHRVAKSNVDLARTAQRPEPELARSRTSQIRRGVRTNLDRHQSVFGGDPIARPLPAPQSRARRGILAAALRGDRTIAICAQARERAEEDQNMTEGAYVGSIEAVREFRAA